MSGSVFTGYYIPNWWISYGIIAVRFISYGPLVFSMIVGYGWFLVTMFLALMILLLLPYTSRQIYDNAAPRWSLGWEALKRDLERFNWSRH